MNATRQETTKMNTYRVAITADGTDCGTYTVQAADPFKARNPAMIAMFARIDSGDVVPFTSGALIEYQTEAV